MEIQVNICLDTYLYIGILLFAHMKVKVLVTQSYPTLCNLMDCSPPDSSIYGISQARMMEGVAIPDSPGDLPNPRIKPRSPTLQTILYHLSHKGCLFAYINKSK